jgi:hypothetical protein
MSEAVDVLHAVERLVELAGAGPGPDAGALKEAHSILFRMGLGSGASGYQAEKLVAVRDGFESWFSPQGPAEYGGDCTSVRGRLLRDIEHLRKALARGSEGQD